MFYAGLKLDQTRTNATTEVRTAIGSILSVQDYNNDSKIEICRSRGCHYTFNTTVYLTSSRNWMTINVTYKG